MSGPVLKPRSSAHMTASASGWIMSASAAFWAATSCRVAARTASGLAPISSRPRSRPPSRTMPTEPPDGPQMKRSSLNSRTTASRMAHDRSSRRGGAGSPANSSAVKTRASRTGSRTQVMSWVASESL